MENSPRVSRSSSSACCSDGHPLSRSTSAAESSLVCSEEDLEDIYLDQEYSLSTEALEVRECGVLSGRARPLSLEPDVKGSSIPFIIRDDLRKQCELDHERATARASLSRRLPAVHRARIVGWMRQVSDALGLHAATLFAATSLLDRFVGSVPELPPDTLLQLLALAAMAVGVKYEEVAQVPSAVWLSLAIDLNGKRLYNPADLQRMEWVLLQAVDWRLHTPNTLTFLTHFLACMQAPTAAATTATTTPAAEVAAPSIQDQYVSAGGNGAEQLSAGDYANLDGLSPRGAASAAAAAEALGLLWWRPVADMAMTLAETSLMHETFLSYEHSTVALACVVLAEHKLCPLPAAARLLPACTRAVAAVCGASGLTLPQLAPGLEGCVEALDRCYGLLGSSGTLMKA
ncbi:hypothetical protein Agub_g6546 [Astrephomene gubernaculifera]|uniref:Cyclin-like domain-containing protein n=1 Tax=Astrephomene gubernaculifera TaxID=47775 RepID=A0AAD3DRA3_9CHLO|nr:hypothetical protein Agub_g6546 [Astrephomene gubernaculifera]